MKLNIYITNLALVLTLTMGLFTLFSANANRYAINCNGCDDTAKKQKLQTHLDNGFVQGEYTFFVIDMVNGNALEFKASVPPQNFDEFGAWSEPATVTRQYRSDQALLNRSVADVRDSIKGIQEAISEMSGEKIKVSEATGYTSAYHALPEMTEFNNYINITINDAATIKDKIRDGKLKLQIMSSNIQIGLSALASISLTINSTVSTELEFADGTTLVIYLTLTTKTTEGYQLKVEVTGASRDAEGNPLPQSARQLNHYNGSSGAFDANALISYFATKGIKVVYGAGTHLGGGGSCETKWKCSADGKTCTLETVSSSC